MFGPNPLDEGSARSTESTCNTQYLQVTGIHATGGIETRNLSKGAATGSRLTPLEHWDGST